MNPKTLYFLSLKTQNKIMLMSPPANYRKKMWRDEEDKVKSAYQHL